MGEMMGEWGTGWMWLGGLWMVLFWVLVILGIVALVKWLLGAGGSRSDDVRGASTALQILQERYARGEIDREEFDQKRRDLGV